MRLPPRARAVPNQAAVFLDDDFSFHPPLINPPNRYSGAGCAMRGFPPGIPYWIFWILS